MTNSDLNNMLWVFLLCLVFTIMFLGGLCYMVYEKSSDEHSLKHVSSYKVSYKV